MTWFCVALVDDVVAPVLWIEMSSSPMLCANCVVIGLPPRESSAADAADSAPKFALPVCDRP